MKLLIDDTRIKVFYKDGSFYKLDGEKIEESMIKKIILDYQELKDILQSQTIIEKKQKKKKDE